jgi:hypothetical protein
MTNKRRNLVGWFAMLRKVLSVIVLAAVLSSTAAFATPAHKKKRIDRHWHGYGFLPGYRPPERIEWERRHARVPYYAYGYYYYWPGRPGIYRGHVTDGAFGPCWTQTPIGPMWNCGK